MTSPYLLDLPAVVSFSGGRTSGYMLRKILDAHGGQPEDLVISFQNTGLEHAGTYEFVERVAKEWGVDIVWLEYDLDEDNKPTHRVVTPETASRNGEPFTKMLENQAFLPNTFRRKCTIELKIKTLERYLKTQPFFTDGYTQAVGLRADEPRRAARTIADDGLVSKECPLYRDGKDSQDVLEFWNAQTFDLDLPLPGNLAGNCVGCFLKGRGKTEVLMREMPEYFDWWVRAEAFVSEKRGRPCQFDQKRPTYKAMMKSVWDQGVFEYEDDDTIPCMCTD